MPSPFFFCRLFYCHLSAVLVRWFGGSFAKLWFVGWIERFCKCATNSVGLRYF